jgi:hypothetical protein
MTSQRDFLERIIKALDDSNIPYMLSGSVTSSLHGQPRATNDTDIIIDPKQEQLLSFVDSLGSDCYVSKQTVLEAFKNNSMFNIIDVQSAWKADFIIRKNRPYSKQEFEKRQIANVMGMDLFVVSPEDSVLSKLEWSKGRESPTQYNDALGVLIVQADTLDYAYLRKWAAELNVQDALEQLLKEAKRIADQ